MTTKITRTLIATTAALGLLVPLSACGAIEDKIQEKVGEKVAGEILGGDVDVDTDGGSISIQGDDGASMEIGGQSLPAHWPADIPLPDNHTLLQVVSLDDADDGQTISAIFDAPGETKVMALHLSEAMTAAGYLPRDAEPITGEMGGMVTDMRSYQSADFAVMVTVSNMADEEGDLSVMYHVTEPDEEQ